MLTPYIAVSTKTDYADIKEVKTILIPDIAWIEIPAGDFVLGDEKEQKTLHLDTFWIGKYPITNNQYQTFIDAGGYEDDRWWHDLIKPEKQASTWIQSNRPRTEVDWYEAVAFTRWFSAISGFTNNEFRLPTEQEWEKAARGTKGQRYPWGNEYRSGHANINETWEEAGEWYIGETTAVGLYPQGRSPYGVMDMAGNVWEWCLNKYDHPEIAKPDTSGDGRVLRGGSWGGSTDGVRTVNRYRNNPVNRNHLRGFRFLSSVPIR